VTAEDSERGTSAVLAAGARAHLTKPIDVRQLQALLDDLLFGEGPDEPVRSGSAAAEGGRFGGDA
jgi:DNA-binding response OmpR family regulator